MGDGVVTRIQNWLQHPFNAQMDLVGWVAFVGLILVLAFAWTRVLAHIVD